MTSPSDIKLLICNCGNILGAYTDQQLQIGSAIMKHLTTTFCVACGKPKQWRPSPQLLQEKK